MRALFAIAFLLTACAKPNYQDYGAAPKATLLFARAGWSGDLRWESVPTVGKDPGSLVLRIWKTDSHPPTFPDAEMDLAAYLWMPSMGHGSSPVTVEKVSGQIGTFRLSDIFIIMHGDWDMHLQLKRSGSVVDETVSTLHY